MQTLTYETTLVESKATSGALSSMCKKMAKQLQEATGHPAKVDIVETDYICESEEQATKYAQEEATKLGKEGVGVVVPFYEYSYDVKQLKKRHSSYTKKLRGYYDRYTVCPHCGKQITKEMLNNRKCSLCKTPLMTATEHTKYLNVANYVESLESRIQQKKDTPKGKLVKYKICFNLPYTNPTEKPAN
jgi:methionyl-tRNA synthetase